MATIFDAVTSLRPNALFVMRDNDVEQIEWLSAGIQPLTQYEVDTEIARLEQEAADKEAAKAAVLASAKTKLAALGLDFDEVNAVIGVAL